MIDYLIPFTKLLGINIILAASLNIINGYCGLFSLGHAGFFAVGAYASAAVTVLWLPELAAHQPFLAMFLACVIGIVVAGAAGFLVGTPCLRLAGDYLAIATIGFGEIIRIVLLNMEAVGAQSGLPGIPPLATMGFVAGSVVVTLWLFNNLIRSSYGRAIISIREDEIAARSMGINVSFYKNFSFVLGSAFAGLAGALFAHLREFIAPANFKFEITIQILLMIVIGGLGSMRGAVIGALLVTFVPELLRLNSFTSMISNLIFGLIMIVVMLGRPQGIMGLVKRR